MIETMTKSYLGLSDNAFGKENIIEVSARKSRLEVEKLLKAVKPLIDMVVKK